MASSSAPSEMYYFVEGTDFGYCVPGSDLLVGDVSLVTTGSEVKFKYGKSTYSGTIIDSSGSESYILCAIKDKQKADKKKKKVNESFHEDQPRRAALRQKEKMSELKSSKGRSESSSRQTKRAQEARENKKLKDRCAVRSELELLSPGTSKVSEVIISKKSKGGNESDADSECSRSSKGSSKSSGSSVSPQSKKSLKVNNDIDASILNTLMSGSNGQSEGASNNEKDDRNKKQNEKKKIEEKSAVKEENCKKTGNKDDKEKKRKESRSEDTKKTRKESTSDDKEEKRKERRSEDKKSGRKESTSDAEEEKRKERRSEDKKKSSRKEGTSDAEEEKRKERRSEDKKKESRRESTSDDEEEKRKERRREDKNKKSRKESTTDDEEKRTSEDDSDAAKTEKKDSDSESEDEPKPKRKRSSSGAKRNMQIFPGQNFNYSESDKGVVKLHEEYEIYVKSKDLDHAQRARTQSQYCRNLLDKVYTRTALKGSTLLGYPPRGKGAGNYKNITLPPRLHPDGIDAIISSCLKLEETKKKWRPRTTESTLTARLAGRLWELARD